MWRLAGFYCCMWVILLPFALSLVFVDVCQVAWHLADPVLCTGHPICVPRRRLTLQSYNMSSATARVLLGEWLVMACFIPAKVHRHDSLQPLPTVRVGCRFYSRSMQAVATQ